MDLFANRQPPHPVSEVNQQQRQAQRDAWTQRMRSDAGHYMAGGPIFNGQLQPGRAPGPSTRIPPGLGPVFRR